MNTAVKNNPLPFSAKMMIITMIMAAILGFSVVKKRYVEDLTGNPGLILKEFPEFEAKLIGSDTKLTKADFVNAESELVMVHFWGTWCAPCEVELPEYVDFIKKFDKSKLKVLIMAVNDEEKKVRKFMKRLGTLPDNIVMGIENSNKMLAQFGTVKVPETYLFSRSGKNLYKYIGPQDWKNSGQFDRIIFYLNNVRTGDSPK